MKATRAPCESGVWTGEASDRSGYTYSLLPKLSSRLEGLVILASLQAACSGGVSLRLELLPEGGEHLLEGDVDVLFPKLLVRYVLVLVPHCLQVVDDAFLHGSVRTGLFRRPFPDEADWFIGGDIDPFEHALGKGLSDFELHHLPNVNSESMLSYRWSSAHMVRGSAYRPT